MAPELSLSWPGGTWTYRLLGYLTLANAVFIAMHVLWLAQFLLHRGGVVEEGDRRIRYLFLLQSLAALVGCAVLAYHYGALASEVRGAGAEASSGGLLAFAGRTSAFSATAVVSLVLGGASEILAKKRGG